MTVRIGTRGSALALAQSGGILRALQKSHRGIHFRLVVVKTMGDRNQRSDIFDHGVVGIFTKELEKALFARAIDIAVHSLKDLPTDLPRGLRLAAFPKREDARDVLISRKRYSLKTLPKGAVVGTGSPRRKRQMEHARSDLRLVDIRGNLDTRVGKVLKDKTLDAVVVARAGLLRLKKFSRYARPIPEEQVLPAVGQGALGLEVRAEDRRTRSLARKLNHRPTEMKVTAERAFLKELEGGCRVPVGIVSKLKAGKLALEAIVFSVSGDAWTRQAITGPASKGEYLGKKLAKKCLKCL